MIKRYHLYGAGCYHEMPEGNWVLHTDHLSALSERDAEIAKLREEVAAFREGLPIEAIKNCIKVVDDYRGNDIPREMVALTNWFRSIAAKVGGT